MRLKQARGRWKNWITKLTLNEWTVLATVVVSLWFLLLAARQWRREWRNSFRLVLATLGLSGALLIGCLIASFRYQSEQPSVVIVPEAVVRRGPFDESPSAFTLRDGSEVAVLNRKDEWREIVDASKRTGWLQGRQLKSLKEPGLTLKK